MSKLYDCSAMLVSEVDEDGVVTEHEGQDRVQDAILFNTHGKIVIIAEQAPVCKIEFLWVGFGYHVITKLAKRVLEETYQYEQGFD